ncbi:MAG: hypothetical protein ABI665_26295 [Vicinamibacterales bacterium]
MVPRLLQVIALLTLLFMFKEWAYVATYRLYLDHRVDTAVGSTAGERFDLEQSGVVPRIVARDERVSFRTSIGQDSTIRAIVTARGAGSYEIHVKPDGGEPVIQAQDITGATTVVCPFPTGNGTVEIVSHGELTWSDLRLQRNLRQLPGLGLLAGLVGGWWIWKRTLRMPAPSWAGPVATLASIAISLLIVEVGLRATAGKLAGISAIRRELGEPTEDPRWQSTAKYGRRLSPNMADAENEWRDGDIIRMGYVPAAMSERGLHRYPFHTDREGFRNKATRDAIDIAALGDSFTDALTMAGEASWPAQLERRLGVAVQNYGTAGFGPQQERLVLEDFALSHHPHLVVLAFFAGNDIRDAERFEEFEHGDPSLAQPTSGWPIREVVIRADSWYLTSAIQAAVSSIAARTGGPVLAQAQPAEASSVSPVDPRQPVFDRGVFSVPAHGRTLRFAFMPPYLNLLNFSEADFAARQGWALTIENIRRMQRASAGAGAQFVVMFIPFKSQVYLPLLQRTFVKDELSRALQFSLKDAPAPPDVDRFAKNRLAQNTLMQRFCQQAGIPLLDLTAALQARVEDGENLYFQDDSHFNEAGEAFAASALAAFLEARGLLRTAGSESGNRLP